MARKHDSTTYISTPELNAAFREIRARTNNGPKHPALVALTLHSLVCRLMKSDQPEDQHLLRSIEGIAELEDWLTSEGGDVWTELEKPERGLFRPALWLLAFDRPFVTAGRKRKKQGMGHSAVILRFQYSQLQSFIQHHPLPPAPEQWNTWLKPHWAAIDEYPLRFAPCICRYRAPEESPPDISTCDTPKDVLLTLMAHIHQSTNETINGNMKPSRRSRTPNRSRSKSTPKSSR
jgi:hypothetical protein